MIHSAGFYKKQEDDIMAVIGAVLGDIAGSQFEFNRPADLDWKNCRIFTEKCRFTDDTVMTLAVKKAVLENTDLAKTMREVGRYYPNSGYGRKFYQWIYGKKSGPYNSFGNGSAMRVSFVGEYYEKLEDVAAMAEKTAAVSHDHPEGIKGAVVTAVCIWMARHGKSRQQIFDYVLEQYPADRYEYSIDKSMDELEHIYKWNETCMGSVPPAMRCFYESDSYESFLRNVFRLKCDSDTLAAIGGPVAEEYYHGVGFDPEPVLQRYLDERMYGILKMRDGK